MHVYFREREWGFCVYRCATSTVSYVCVDEESEQVSRREEEDERRIYVIYTHKNRLNVVYVRQTGRESDIDRKAE